MIAQQLEYSCNREKMTADELVNFFSLACKQNTFLLKDIDNNAFAEKIAKNAEVIVCRTITEKIAGLMAFYKNNGVYVYITFVCVLKDYQKNSIFSKMLLMLEQYARGNDYKRIQLEVASDNIAAQKVYQHKGFFIIREENKSIFMEKNI